MNYKKTLVVTPCYYPANNLPNGVKMFMGTAELHGIEITPIGLNLPYPGHYKGKIETFFPQVSRMRGYDYVIMADCCDVLFATGIGEMHHWFSKYNSPFVMSGEAGCWPFEKEYKDITPNAPNKFRYLNSGFYMATWDGFLKVFNNMLKNMPEFDPKKHVDDQGFFYKAWMNDVIQIKVEYECRLCQSLIGIDEHWSFLNKDIEWGKRPKNKHTGAYPCVFHGNGSAKSWLPGVFDMLTK